MSIEQNVDLDAYHHLQSQQQQQKPTRVMSPSSSVQTSEYDALIQRLAQLMMARDDNSGSYHANDDDDDKENDDSSIDQQPVAGVRILSFGH